MINKKIYMTMMAMAFVSVPVMGAEEGSPIMRPERCVEYEYDKGDWSLFRTTDYLYDAKGNILSQARVYGDGESSTIDYIYDSFGMKTSELSMRNDNGVIERNRTIMAYDPIVHDFEISNTSYDWENEAWKENRNRTSTVTRDAAGNVTEVVRVIISGGKVLERNRMVVSYGQDGKATEINFYKDTSSDGAEPVWSLESFSLKNIVWYATDGQIMSRERVYDIIDCENSSNLLKSVDVIDDDNKNCHYEYQYVADAPGDFIRERHILNGEKVQIAEKTIKQYVDYGGWIMTGYNYESSDGISDEPVTTGVVKKLYDSHGNLIEDSYIQYSGDENVTLTYASIDYYENTYDDKGNLIEVIEGDQHLKEDGTLSEPTPSYKYVYSGYKDVTDQSGVEGIESDDADAPVIYFDLQGFPVEKPGHGLYIRKQGNRVSKILL